MMFAAGPTTPACSATGILLREGVPAWLTEDHCKAVHILVPHVEAGLRALLSRLGRPTTKAHRDMSQARVVITMGELLHNEENAAALGPNGTDFVLHFRCLYTDPRGEKWRNGIAHGLLPPNRIHPGMTLWVIHSLLLLGTCCVRRRRSRSMPSLRKESDFAASARRAKKRHCRSPSPPTGRPTRSGRAREHRSSGDAPLRLPRTARGAKCNQNAKPRLQDTRS
jgi:hypothetical protein